MLPLLAQPSLGVIKGRVADAITRRPIPNAVVEVKPVSGPSRTARTGTDGTYSILGFQIGESVTESCSASGYAPDPWTRAAIKIMAETPVEIVLICDCKDDAYWAPLAARWEVDAQASDPKFLDSAWDTLAVYGLSAESRAAAARELVKAIPAASTNSHIVAFATTDPLALRKAEQEIRTVLATGSATPSPTSLPPEVAGDVAAVEVRRHYEAISSASTDLKSCAKCGSGVAEVGNVWGEAAKKSADRALERQESMKASDRIHLSSDAQVKSR